MPQQGCSDRITHLSLCTPGFKISSVSGFGMQDRHAKQTANSTMSATNVVDATNRVRVTLTPVCATVSLLL